MTIHSSIVELSWRRGCMTYGRVFGLKIDVANFKYGVFMAREELESQAVFLEDEIREIEDEILELDARIDDLTPKSLGDAMDQIKDRELALLRRRYENDRAALTAKLNNRKERLMAVKNQLKALPPSAGEKETGHDGGSGTDGKNTDLTPEGDAELKRLLGGAPKVSGDD